MIAPWTEWVARLADGDDGEWTLVCMHGAVTSEEVKHAYAPDEALGLFVLIRRTTDLTDEEVAITALRMLLGRLMGDRHACRCAHRPFQIVRDGSRLWIEDVP